jgi:hypothetical protein
MQGLIYILGIPGIYAVKDFVAFSFNFIIVFCYFLWDRYLLEIFVGVRFLFFILLWFSDTSYVCNLLS